MSTLRLPDGALEVVASRPETVSVCRFLPLLMLGVFCAPAAQALLPSQVLTAPDAAAGDNFGYAVATSGDYIVVGAKEVDGVGAAYLYRRGAEEESWSFVKKLTPSDGAVGDSFGWHVAIDGDIVAVGANQKNVTASQSGAVYVFERNHEGQDNWGEVARLAPEGAVANTRFGWTVSLSGDLLAAGAVEQGGDCTIGSFGYGAAYLYGRDVGGAGAWGLIKRVVDPEPSNCEHMSVVSVRGTTLAAGAFDANDNCPATNPECGTGAVIVFERDQGGVSNWGKLTRLVVPDGEATNEGFGSNLVLSENRLLVGAFLADPPENAGAAFLFGRDQGGTGMWGHIKSFAQPEPQAQDWFGEGVALTGSLAVIGARWDATTVPGSGAAFIYERDHAGPESWGLRFPLQADEPSDGDQFGADVAASPRVVVVGARQDDRACPANPSCNSGSAFVFDLVIFSDGFETGLTVRWSQTVAE